MKKLILIGIMALGLTGCAVKGDYSSSPITRGRETHNFAVIYSQNTQILRNQEIIIEQQRQILKLLGYVRIDQLEEELNEKNR